MPNHRSTARARTLAAFTAVATLLACAGNGDPEVPNDGGAMPAPGPDPVAVTTLTPESGPAGTSVTLRAQGFAPNATLDLGFGPPQSEYEVIRQVRSDSQGRVEVSAEVPSWAEAGRSYLFVVADTDSRPKAISDAFHVTDADGALRVRGTITDEGVECTALRAADGSLYTLVGRTAGLEEGAEVIVEGTVAQASICMQGTTIEVREVERP